MITSLDIVDILFTRIKGSALETAISGDICKHKRDGGSKLEDVVVNALPAINTQLQQSFANVNVHVPDLVINVNGQEQKQPNHVRLKELADITMTVLDNQQTSGYYYEVEQQSLFDDPEAGDHYINFRIKFFIENL